MGFIYSAAVLTKDTEIERVLPEFLLDWGVAAKLFRDVESFQNSFGNGLASAYGDPDLTPYYARSRPDLIILDLGDPDDEHFQDFLGVGIQITGMEPRAEILLLLDAQPRQLDKLIPYSLGSIHPREGWEQGLNLRSLRRSALRLARLGFLRHQQDLLKATKRSGISEEAREVFLCHAGEDEKRGFGVRRYIEMTGLHVWFSFTEADGPFWRSQRDRALEQARCMVVLLTQACVDSPYCNSEVDYYRYVHRGSRRILPLVVDDIPPPDVMSALRSYPPLPRLNGFGRRLNALIDMLASP